jgi:hypothetical protein
VNAYRLADQDALYVYHLDRVTSKFKMMIGAARPGGTLLLRHYAAEAQQLLHEVKFMAGDDRGRSTRAKGAPSCLL